jgi:hypothetical protein
MIHAHHDTTTTPADAVVLARDSSLNPRDRGEDLRRLIAEGVPRAGLATRSGDQS